jgi:1,4-alpha-glucan branching enzyme
VKDHILRFTRLYEQLASGHVDEEYLAKCEWVDNLFPDVNWRYWE